MWGMWRSKRPWTVDEHRPAESDTATVFTRNLFDDLNEDAVQLTVEDVAVFPSCHDGTVWESVMAAAYPDPQSAWGPRTFEGEGLNHARAIFLLGIFFLADVDLHTASRDLTISNRHDEFLEISSGSRKEIQSIFAIAGLKLWKR